MAAHEKPAAAPAAPAADGAAPAAPKKKGGLKMIIAAVAVVVLEVATVGITAKMAGGPRVVTAETPVPPKAAEVIERDVEVKLLADKLPNSQSGKQFLYDLQVVVKVSEKNKTKVTELFAERDAEIRDQVRTIIASSDPSSLTEPGLETLRRKISYQLEQLVGKDLLKEVLIPRCLPIPPMYRSGIRSGMWERPRQVRAGQTMHGGMT
jgi:flagellar basal body-associated protein FliL